MWIRSQCRKILTEIHKVNKEYSLAVKKFQDYQDVLENRRKKK